MSDPLPFEVEGAPRVCVMLRGSGLRTAGMLLMAVR